MDLYVVSDTTGVGELGDYVITTDQFKLREYHPFLATQKWDKAVIELNDQFPLGLLSQLINAYRIIPMIKTQDISMRVMKLLCEVVPDRAVEMRSLYCKDKAEYMQLIKDIASKEGWMLSE